MAQYLQSEAEFYAILADAGDKLVAIEFYANWCPPCKMIEPIFEAMVSEYPTVKFLKVDVDEWPDIASYCGVSSMPTFVFFKNSQRIKKFSGARPDTLKKVIKSLK